MLDAVVLVTLFSLAPVFGKAVLVSLSAMPMFSHLANVSLMLIAGQGEGVVPNVMAGILAALSVSLTLMPIIYGPRLLYRLLCWAGARMWKAARHRAGRQDDIEDVRVYADQRTPTLEYVRSRIAKSRRCREGAGRMPAARSLTQQSTASGSESAADQAGG